MGCSSEFMNCGTKFLHWEHSATASLLSRSIPGQNHWSCSLSHVWSHLKWPLSAWVLVVSSNPFTAGSHSNLAARSFAFVHIRHSLPPSIVKLSAWCHALRLVHMSGMSQFVSAFMTSLSHGSSANCLCMSANLSVSCPAASCIMSLTTPLLASQSGRTDHSAPSLSLLGPRASDHLRLIASATTFVTPGQCLMSTMFQQVIDSSHRAWVELCFLLRRTSRRAWQSVSISIGDPYIMVSNSSSANFSAANSSRNGS